MKRFIEYFNPFAVLAAAKNTAVLSKHGSRLLDNSADVGATPALPPSDNPTTLLGQIQTEKNNGTYHSGHTAWSWIILIFNIVGILLICFSWARLTSNPKSVYIMFLGIILSLSSSIIWVYTIRSRVMQAVPVNGLDYIADMLDKYPPIMWANENVCKDPAYKHSPFCKNINTLQQCQPTKSPETNVSATFTIQE